MTAGRGTQHAVMLQMAAASAFGWENREKLDALAVGISHPDGVVGLLSGGGSFKTHATTVPFIQMELASPNVRTLFTSYDVVGGRHTLIVAYATERWRKENPKLYQATYPALAEAMNIIRKDTTRGRRAVLEAEPSKLGLEAIQSIINDDKMLYFMPAAHRRDGLCRPHDEDRTVEEQAGELEGRVLRQRARAAGRLTVRRRAWSGPWACGAGAGWHHAAGRPRSGCRRRR